MAPLEAAYTLAGVLGLVCVVLLFYILIPAPALPPDAQLIACQRDLEKARARMEVWRDAYHSEAKQLADSRDSLDALRDSHAQLQADFLEQGRSLVLAQAKAKAAERVE